MEANPKIIVAENETTNLQLKCEMSGYIEPDENLQWFRHGEKIENSNKYNISYVNGSKLIQMGGIQQKNSRVSILTISDFKKEDRGFYSCNTTETKVSEAIYISLGEPGELIRLLKFNLLISMCIKYT